MKKFQIAYMDGYDEVRDADTQEVIFSTKLDDDLIEYVHRTTMDELVINKVVEIWNTTGEAIHNLWSGSDGKVDEYLLHEGKCTQEEREVIVESLYQHANQNVEEFKFKLNLNITGTPQELANQLNEYALTVQEAIDGEHTNAILDGAEWGEDIDGNYDVTIKNV